jgi:hypothetical protein
MQLNREVAVAVPYGPEPLERTDMDPRFLEELPPRGLRGALGRLDPSAGELPEPWQETGRRTALHQPARSVAKEDDRRPDLGSVGPGGPNGNRPRVRPLPAGTARSSYRADRAAGPEGKADGLAQLHHGLVERPGRLRRQDGEERAPEARAHSGVADVTLLERPAGRDAQPVRLEGNHRPAEGEGGDGSGDVRTDAGQLLELVHRAREPTPSLPHEEAGGLVEAMGPGVVAGPLPDLEDLPDRGPRERLDGGEPLDEPGEVAGRGGDARLLQEDLGDPDVVRLPVRAPGKRPTVGVVPSEKVGRERGRERLDGRRRSGTHGPRGPDEEEA